jgi:hypothetical protein
VDFCDEYKNKQHDYLHLVTETLSIYNLYKHIYNNGLGMLNDEHKSRLKIQKETIARNLLKQLLSLENIVLLIKDFFKNIDELDQQVRYSFGDIKNILSDITNTMSLYFYYQKAYVAFDKLLINQYEYFIKLKYLFNSYYKQFWITVEKERLAEIIKTYNFYMILYKKNNNVPIKEISFNEEASAIIVTKNDLPAAIYNKFL